MVDKSVVSGFVDNFKTIKDRKLATLAAKTEPKAEQDKVMELQALDSSYFRGKSSSEDDGRQKYLVFRAVYKYFNI